MKTESGSNNPLPPAPHSGQSEHTPVPWRKHDMECNTIVGPDHRAIAFVMGLSRSGIEDAANLSLIVEAVNSHASNLAELERLRSFASNIEKSIAARDAHWLSEMGPLLARNAALETALKSFMAFHSGPKSVPEQIQLANCFQLARAALTPSTLTAQSNAQAGTKEGT